MGEEHHLVASTSGQKICCQQRSPPRGRARARDGCDSHGRLRIELVFVWADAPTTPDRVGKKSESETNNLGYAEIIFSAPSLRPYRVALDALISKPPGGSESRGR